MGKRPSAIVLTDEQRQYLEGQTRIRTLQAQIVTRARILLLRAQAVSIDAIADKVGLNRCSVMLCLKKFHEGGIDHALYDAPGRGRNAEITDEEKASYKFDSRTKYQFWRQTNWCAERALVNKRCLRYANSTVNEATLFGCRSYTLDY